MSSAAILQESRTLPQLIGMLDSPYVRRVAIALDVLGVPFEHLSLSVFSTFEQFRTINPVVKAPTWICADGTVLMDSSLILQCLEADSAVALWPVGAAERRAAFRAVGLALAACEKGAQLVYERQLRPPEKQHEPWCSRVRSQMLAAWTALEQQIGASPSLFAEARQHPAMATAVVWEFTRTMLSDEVDTGAFPAIAALAARLEQSAPFLAYPSVGPGVPALSA